MWNFLWTVDNLTTTEFYFVLLELSVYKKGKISNLLTSNLLYVLNDFRSQQLTVSVLYVSLKRLKLWVRKRYFELDKVITYVEGYDNTRPFTNCHRQRNFPFGTK